jgi:anti-anti-sigma factor
VWGKELVERHVFEISRLADGTGLKLSGELDAHSAAALTDALTVFQGADEVWLDMTEVTFIDSSGLSSILSFARSRNGNGRIVIVDPTSVVGPIFKIIGLHDRAAIEVVADSSLR